MEIENILSIILNYGAIGGCLVYFLLKDKKNEDKAIQKQEETNRLIDELKDTITELKNLFEFYMKKGE